LDGLGEGFLVLDNDGQTVEGSAVGSVLGAAVGSVLEAAVGSVLGAAVGSVLGAAVGSVLGAAVIDDDLIRLVSFNCSNNRLA
jgi:outer membrane lipoprotein SlyB